MTTGHIDLNGLAALPSYRRYQFDRLADMASEPLAGPHRFKDLC